MERIASLDDPRVAAYRNLRDRTLRGEGLFVAEGRLVVRRLLESDYTCESVFVAEQHAAEFAPLLGPGVPCYVGSEALLAQVVGFRFHLGVLAAGRRCPLPRPAELRDRLDCSGPLRLVVCPAVTNPDNLGLIFRSAAALGIQAVVLGQRCCDPLSRRSLRVSMGGVLKLPLARAAQLGAELPELKSRFGLSFVGAVASGPAEPLPKFRWPERAALLVGNEYYGLERQWLECCDHLVTIPMRPGVDSLNLGVAAGIFLYEMQRSVL